MDSTAPELKVESPFADSTVAPNHCPICRQSISSLVLSQFFLPVLQEVQPPHDLMRSEVANPHPVAHPVEVLGGNNSSSMAAGLQVDNDTGIGPTPVDQLSLDELAKSSACASVLAELECDSLQLTHISDQPVNNSYEDGHKDSPADAIVISVADITGWEGRVVDNEPIQTELGYVKNLGHSLIESTSWSTRTVCIEKLKRMSTKNDNK